MFDIKIGDVVQLKSGGLVMIVQDIGDYSSCGIDYGVYCVWFDNKDVLQQGVYVIVVLKFVD